MRWCVKQMSNTETADTDRSERVLQYRQQYHSSDRVGSQLYKLSVWSEWQDVSECIKETENEH